MLKYFQIFKISFQLAFTYKVTFFMWRIRNLIQILVTYFLWITVFSNPQSQIFGYNQVKIITYVFVLMIVRAVVFSARALDVSGDISNGNLSNYLVRPFSYIKFWIASDFSRKFLDMVFAFFEFCILFLIFKPNFFFPTTLNFVLFLLSLLLACIIYFCLVFLISSVPFWAPELGWASQFLVVVVIIEFLSGSFFPIDILPNLVQKIVMLSPFPYTIFFPIQVYLEKSNSMGLVNGFAVSVFWAIVLWFLMNRVWQKGLKVYQATGR